MGRWWLDPNRSDPLEGLRGELHNHPNNTTWIDEVAPPDPRGHWVYWLCDEDGNPVYIGRSSNLKQRLQHWLSQARYYPWGEYWDKTSVKLFKCGSLEASDRLERRMIDTHQPRGNSQRWEVQLL